jgi:hypothetical protein
MNNQQLVSLISKLIVALCAWVAAKWGFSLDGPGIAATAAPMIVGLLATYWAHRQHAGPADGSNGNPGKNVTGIFLLAGFATVMLTGCTFVQRKTTTTVGPTGTNVVAIERAQIWGGYIVEHSSTLFGADVESPSGANNGTVKLKVGFGNDYTRYTPTATNALFAPRYVTSLGIHQTLASSHIEGESASGDTFYSTTNATAGASVPGTPTPQQAK